MIRTLFVGLLFAVLPGTQAAEPAPRSKSNIILFLVDDMGWMDTTVNGSTYYETPNMERLARRAMRFTDAFGAK